MTSKLIAIYRKPDDEEAFLAHYRNIHLPLVEKVPGLVKAVVNRVTGAAGDSDLFLIAELHFADRQALKNALRSEENQAAGRDLQNFAAGLVTVVFADEE